MKPVRALLFLLVMFMFVPATLAEASVFKMMGVLLAIFVLPMLATHRQSLPPTRYIVALVILWAAAFAGGLAYGDVRFSYLQKMAMNILLFLLVSATARTVPTLRLILLGVAAGGLIAVFSGLVTVSESLKQDRISGIIGNPNGYGQICVQTVVCLVGLALSSGRRLARWLLFLLVIPCLLGVFQSASRGASVALLASLVCFALLGPTRRAGIVIALSTAALAIVLAPQEFLERWSTAFRVSKAGRVSGLESRVQLTRGGMEIFAEYPITGVGAGNAASAMEGTSAGQRAVAHSVLVQTLAETGGVGFLAFLYLFWCTLRAYYHFARSGRVTAVFRTISATFFALFLGTLAGQSSSGNYIHAIWYVLLAVGLNLAVVARGADRRVSIPLLGQRSVPRNMLPEPRTALR